MGFVCSKRGIHLTPEVEEGAPHEYVPHERFEDDDPDGFRGRQHFPVAAEIQKKIPMKTRSRTPSSIKTGSITKRRV